MSNAISIEQNRIKKILDLQKEASSVKFTESDKDFNYEISDITVDNFTLGITYARKDLSGGVYLNKENVRLLRKFLSKLLDNNEDNEKNAKSLKDKYRK